MRAPILILILTALLTACSGGPKSAESTAGKLDGPQKPTEVFDLNQVELTCEDPSCPEAVGVLMYLENTDRGLLLHRCTAFLSATDEVTSNGHCYQPSYAEGYFFTRTDIKGKTFRKIKSVKTRLADSGLNPDVAIFELEAKIKDVAPLKTRKGQPIATEKLTGFVSARKSEESQIKLQLNRIECLVHRHGTEFPFDVSESPDILRAFDCRAEKGNSGGPLFADLKSGVVDYIQQSIPENPPTRWWIQATNLACIDNPGCLKVTEAELTARVLQQQTEMNQKVFSRQKNPQGGIHFAAKVKTTSSNDGVSNYNIFYFPDCREGDVPAELQMEWEQVWVGPDEWGNLELRVAEYRTMNSTLKVTYSGLFTLTTSDPEPGVPAESDIALPLCD